MTVKPSAYEPKSRLRKGTKLDDGTLAAITLAFCNSIAVDRCAVRTGVSRKRVRDLYLELRDRLTHRRFARWHRANALLPAISDADTLVLIRTTFFYVLAECAGNTRCQKNFDARLRKSRQCRSCPLAGRFTDAATCAQALALVDVVRAFYARLGLYGERDQDPVSLFRRKLIHTASMAAAMHHTKKAWNGMPDQADQAELSIHSLFKALILNLVERPI